MKKTAAQIADFVFEKIALNSMMKYLLRLAPESRYQAVRQLPKELRSTASYKLLGNQAGNIAAKLPGGAGHGAEHVFDVTRDAQKFTEGKPLDIRRRATLGGLLHDVGREAEGTMRDRLGKKILNKSPQFFHSELGGRFSKNFLNQNRQYAQYVPGLRKGQLSNVVRAHDTDAHAFRPFTTRVLGKDPAASATYLADKVQGLGEAGANRTISMAQKFKETADQTRAVVDKNVGKYNNIINNYATSPIQMQQMQTGLTQYQQRMQDYYNSMSTMAPKAASHNKEASVGNELAKLITVLNRRGASSKLENMLREVITKNPKNPGGAILDAIHKLPMEDRVKALDMAAKML